MKTLAITGLGLWAPGFPDAASFFAGVANPAVVKPRCALVSPRLLRGSSRFARMLGEVVQRAAAQAGSDLRSIATVYGSSLGEIETMVLLLDMLFNENGALSPTRFKNSVHNAASGLVSIGTENTAFSTALAAGDRSFEASMLEAWVLLEQGLDRVVVAVADDRPPEPLRALMDHEGLAVALHLERLDPERGAPADRTLALLSDLAPAPADAPLLWAEVPEPWERNPASAGLPLLRAILSREAGRVPLAMRGQAGLSADLRFLQ